MATKTADERLTNIHQHIDGLQARAQTAAGAAKQSIEAQVDALRQREASARAAVSQAQQTTASKVAEQTDAAQAKLQQLETRVKEAEHGFAAELAEDRQTFVDAMHADLEDFKVAFHELDTEAAGLAGAAREQAKAAIRELRGSWDRLAARVAEVREASGEQWRERKKDVDAGRVKLEQKLDEASKKFG